MESTTQPQSEAAVTNGKPAADESFEVRRPIDGSVIQTVAIDSPQDVAAKVARIRAAQPA